MSVEVQGAQKLRSALVSLREGLNPETAKAIKKVAREIRDDAKRLCPVDTGSLQRSIRLQTHARPAQSIHKIGVSAGGYVTNPRTGRKVDYAAYVEFGTSRNPPQPFMRPAAEKNKPKLVRELLRLIARRAT